MRLSTSAALLGAASTAFCVQEQEVLGGSPWKLQKPNLIDELDFESWTKPLEDVFGKFTSEAKAAWEDLSLLAPEVVQAFKKNALRPKLKTHQRRPDSHWDHIIRGAEVQDLWVQDETGQSHRKVGGRLENFDVRVKKVDPSKLGIDSVKQYTGYLDDNEQDKHLFYCKPCSRPTGDSHR